LHCFPIDTPIWWWLPEAETSLKPSSTLFFFGIYPLAYAAVSDA
jgi:hypothetical protein